jgi:hypothetical protein
VPTIPLSSLWSASLFAIVRPSDDQPSYRAVPRPRPFDLRLYCLPFPTRAPPLLPHQNFIFSASSTPAARALHTTIERSRAPPSVSTRNTRSRGSPTCLLHHTNFNAFALPSGSRARSQISIHPSNSPSDAYRKHLSLTGHQTITRFCYSI